MSRRWAPLVAALSVVAIAVAVSLVIGNRGSGEPPALRLASGSGADSGVAADAPMATGKLAAQGSSFELVGELPSGPDEAKAHPLPRGAATESEVRRLADALGVKDEPRRVEHAWQVGSLRVEDSAGNPWSMFVGCGPEPLPPDSGGSPDDAVSSTGGVTICPGGTVDVGVATGSAGSSGSATSGTASTGPGKVSSGSGSSGSGGAATTPNSTTVAPPPPAPAPAATPCPAGARCPAPVLTTPQLPPMPTLSPADLDQARRVAKGVLDQLGLSDAEVSVQPAGEQAFVQADPRVDGLRTWGWATSLQIDADGKVVGGNGYLGKPTSGASYPLVSAKEAYDALPELPRPMYLCPANADCPQPAPAKVTGAELGLQLTALADEEAALLPAWLFKVEGWPTPLAQPAIEPRFLQLPKPIGVDPGIKPVPPAEPPSQTEPAPPRSAFGFDTAYPTDEPNVLIVQYGDSGSCPHTNVEPLVKESADSIVVTLEGDTMLSKRACTDDYRQQLVTLKLTSPLGDRTVIDGSRGQPVPVDRTCARPMGQPSPPKGCKG